MSISASRHRWLFSAVPACFRYRLPQVMRITGTDCHTVYTD